MSEEKENYEEINNGVQSRTVINNRLASYLEKAKERLDTLGGKASKEDVLDAIYERGEHNEPLVSIVFSKEIYDKGTMEKVRDNIRFTTVNASADFFDVDGYGTLVLYFDKALEASTLLRELDAYGQEISRADRNDEEIVNGTFTSVPVLLGGKYSLVCSNPKQWVPLSQRNEPGVIDEIRVYFDPGEYGILEQPGFDSELAVKEIQSELVQTAWEYEQRMQRENERREYEETRERERMEALAGKKSRHTFRV